MSTLVVPGPDRRPWPTLGPQVCEFIESFLVHGPGDIRGEPARIDDETRGLIYRAYEVYPRRHQRKGRRRFKRVGISLRKGTAKTEKAAWIAACELHPDAPVRCDGFDARGQPVGIGVGDPYIPMVAYTEEQTEDLAYAALYVILCEGPLADDFDIGLERIARLNGDGKAQALASAPDARDGARTTFQHFDETHRFTLPRLRDAHKTMLANIPKRKLADPWSLDTTTAPSPGEGSVAEGTMDYAKAVDAGKIKDARLFFFHRQAGDGHDLETEEGVRAAVIEASGPAAEWSDIDSIVELWRDPQTDRAYYERVWLNRPVQTSAQAFDAERWKELAREQEQPDAGEAIVIGFDGSRFMDATALIATHVKSGYQFPLGIWERPAKAPDGWEVPEGEVNAALAAAFEHWNVLRVYADPPYWETTVDQWAGDYGDKRVVRWWTNRPKQTAYAIRAYQTAIKAGEVTHSGDETFARHIGNARRQELNFADDQGQPLHLIRKERSDSPHKMDAAMAGTLSWEARGDEIAAGALKKKKRNVTFH